MGAPFFRHADAPWIWLPKVARIESRRHTAPQRVANSSNKSQPDEQCRPANAIASFKPRGSAHVARIPQSGDRDSSSALDTLSDSELEHVILHELGHLRRRDDWTNLAQKLIEALLPIQPAVYWIGHRMAIEREMAWMTGSSSHWRGGALCDLPHKSGRTFAMGTRRYSGGWRSGNRSQLFSRVHHMLDRTRNAAVKLALGPLGVAIAAIGNWSTWARGRQK